MPLSAQAAPRPLDLLLAGLALGAPIAYLLLLEVRPYPGDVVLKSSMCVALAVLAWRHRARLLAVALSWSAAGDALLAIDGERLFIAALASFLITQALYCVLFVQAARLDGVRLRGVRAAWAATVVAFAVGFGAVLGGVGDIAQRGMSPGMTAAIAIYMTAIVTMAVLSMRVRRWLAGAGALMFVASDSLIALDRFVWSAEWISPAIWATYAAAQLAITYALLAPRGHS